MNGELHRLNLGALYDAFNACILALDTNHMARGCRESAARCYPADRNWRAKHVVSESMIIPRSS